MRIYDIIVKKRNGGVLSKEEIEYFVEGYTGGEIPDYQMAALFMAIYFRGMDDGETRVMTQCMARSGDMVDLSAIDGVKVDKHSTGGVGDKTTLIVAPIVAACGAKVAKMSGRGLGHTGGTVDKLESIPGLRTTIDSGEFFKIVNEVGAAVIGQSGNLAPADKKMYALRDVTGTVENISLIAASIMSKKLASGSDCIMLDVKTGSGAFMKSIEESVKLAQAMVNIGEGSGRKTAAFITNMDMPLGHAIGNSLEVIEAVQTLKGRGPRDLTRICVKLAAGMLNLADKGDMETCEKLAVEAIESGEAFSKLRLMVAAQGGDASFIDDTEKFEKAGIVRQIKAERSGYIYSMDTEELGIASSILGAGREKKEDAIDYSAGIMIGAKTGDRVEKGDVLAVLYTNKEEQLSTAEEIYRNAVKIAAEKPDPEPLIYAHVAKDGVKYFEA